MSLEYKILRTGSYGQLEQDVNENLRKDWKLLGNPFSSSVDGGRLICQAITKETKIIAGKKKQSIPFEKILSLYHEHCPSLGTVQVLNDVRKRGIERLWNFALGMTSKTDSEPMEFIKTFFQEAEASPRLRGEKNDQRSSWAHWKADLEFITRDAKIGPIAEGKYSETGELG